MPFSQGELNWCIYDLREDSPTKGSLQEIFFGEDNYCLVQIPPGLANGYKAYGDKMVILANCASEPHRSEEMIRMDPFTSEIPYDWSAKTWLVLWSSNDPSLVMTRTPLTSQFCRRGY